VEWKLYPSGKACGRAAGRVRTASGEPGRVERRIPLARPPGVEADVAALRVTF
jgi:hypothetical protein